MKTALSLRYVELYELKASPFSHACGIAERAALLLENRSEDELMYAAQAVDWMISQGLLEYCKAESYTENEIEEIVHASLQKKLQNLTRIFSISELDEIPNAVWSEMIAAYALEELATANLYLEGKSFELDLYEDECMSEIYNSPSLVAFVSSSNFLLRATEAVVVAEYLVDFEQTVDSLAKHKFDGLVKYKLDNLVKDKISLNNKNAAIKRHKPVNKIKERFNKYYLEHKDAFHNKAELARRFYMQELAPEEKKIINPLGKIENVVRVLSDAEREYREKDKEKFDI